MRDIAKNTGTARRRAVDRLLGVKLMGKSALFETLVFEEARAEAQRKSAMRLNAAAVMLNRALAEYSDERRPG